MSTQQPVMVYPNPVTNQPSSSHSNGSFGTVFIVLAVIVVISAIACCLGRLCSRRHHHPKAEKQNHHHNSRTKERGPQNHNFQGREGDIEFGFGKGIPSGKQFGNGEAKGGGRPAGNNGEINGEGPRFGHEGEAKAVQFSTL